MSDVMTATIIRMKIFDMNNPNCVFTEKPLIDLFQVACITLDNEVIGHVTADLSKFEWVNNELYSNVHIWKRYIFDTNKLEFNNYVISGESMENGTFKILNIESIDLKFAEHL